MSVRYIPKNQAVPCPKCRCSVAEINGRLEDAELSRDPSRPSVRVLWGKLHRCPHGEKY